MVSFDNLQSNYIFKPNRTHIELPEVPGKIPNFEAKRQLSANANNL